jgi:diguanylate cyclase (GGDEF)-like protein/PAS domain S-box-containing protein
MTDVPAGTQAPFKVLLVEDNPGDVRLLVHALENVQDTTFHVRTADRIATAVELLASDSFDLVLLDLSLPDCRGLANLDHVLTCRADVPVVVITGLDDETLALEALRRGAQDYVVKDTIDRTMLARTVRYATERSYAAATVRAADAKFKLMFEESPVGFVFGKLDGDILQANRAFLTLAGYEENQLTALNLWALVHRPGQPEHHLQAPPERRGGPVEMELVHANGDSVPVSVTWAVVDERAGGERVWLTFDDLTQHKIIEQQLRQLSMYDALTGLANRNLFNASLTKAMARAARSGRVLALLMLDLDRFKGVNDTLGHEAGDIVLRGVAERLTRELRTADQIARIGGDEFAVTLEDVHRLPDVALVARRIIAALARPFEFKGQEIYCGVSVGIAGWPEHAGDAPALRRAADLAMYESKKGGGNAYRFYSDSIRTEFDRLTSLENALRRARRRQEFTLHYQPQIDLASNRITGAEALLRWQHPERGLVCAGEFIEGLESSGQIEPVGYWAVDAALEQLERWHKTFDRSLRVAINLSARQLFESKFLAHMRYALQRYAVDPTHVELEVTESSVVSSGERELLNALHGLGVRITVDDFGTGYSSLQYLKLLPIQALKIDRGFVNGIPSSQDDVAIVSATLALARNFELEVVAEGVETQAQLEFLRERGCDRAQGYLIGKPMSAEDFSVLLREPAAHTARIG